MSYRYLIFTSVIFCVLLHFSSCQHIDGLLQDEEPEDIVEEPEPEPEPEEIVEPVDPEVPEWYRSDEPVWSEGDTIHVAASAVSADSSDARKLAFRALDAFTETAFTMVMEELLDSEEIPGDGNTDRILDMLVLRGREYEAGLPGSEEAFFYRSDETDVRFYARRSFRKSEITEIIRSSL